jgi:hypothetical protein
LDEAFSDGSGNLDGSRFHARICRGETTFRPGAPPAGTVLEVSGTSLRIERTLKGKAEIMEFILEKPFSNIAAGDPVKVSYLEKDGRNVLIRVAPAQKTAVKKAVKKDLPKEMKPVAPSAAPATK